MSYTTQSIKTLTGMEAVRRSLGVYLGDTVRDTAVREIIDNAADETSRGYGTRVDIIFHPDQSIEVRDDGRGLPVDTDPETGVNGIVKTLGTINSGSNFDSETITAGVHGIGASATTAISLRMDITSHRDGKAYRQQFRNGVPGEFAGDTFDPYAEFTETGDRPLTGERTDVKRGTHIRFLIDPDIAPDDELDIESIIFRARLLHTLTPGLNLTITAEGETSTFPALDDTGSHVSLDYVAGTAPKATFAGSTLYARNGKDEPLDYHVSFDTTLAVDETPKHVAVTNGVYNPDGGCHMDAVIKGISEAVSEKRVRNLDLNSGEPYPPATSFAATLNVVAAIRTPGPSYTAQDKRAMVYSRGMFNSLAAETSRQAQVWAAAPANADALRAWATTALEHARLTRRIESAKTEARTSRARAASGNLSMPDKLMPSGLVGRETNNEIFLVEGDSAANTATGARFPRHQAVFPFRGKVLNSLGEPLGSAPNPKGRTDRERRGYGMRRNAEFRDLETILGCGAREHCDPDKSRYSRIILACDADPDGGNITSQLLLMFYVNFRPLIESGMVYISQPPLHVITYKGGRVYALDDEERDQTLAQLRKDGATGIKVKRCKGLGEMLREEFRDTVTNPATRALKQVRATDDTFEDLTLFFKSGSSYAEGRRQLLDDMNRTTDLTALVD